MQYLISQIALQHVTVRLVFLVVESISEVLQARFIGTCRLQDRRHNFHTGGAVSQEGMAKLVVE